MDFSPGARQGAIFSRQDARDPKLTALRYRNGSLNDLSDRSLRGLGRRPVSARSVSRDFGNLVRLGSERLGLGWRDSRESSSAPAGKQTERQAERHEPRRFRNRERDLDEVAVVCGAAASGTGIIPGACRGEGIWKTRPDRGFESCAGWIRTTGFDLWESAETQSYLARSDRNATRGDGRMQKIQGKVPVSRAADEFCGGWEAYGACESLTCYADFPVECAGGEVSTCGSWIVRHDVECALGSRFRFSRTSPHSRARSPQKPGCSPGAARDLLGSQSDFRVQGRRSRSKRLGPLRSVPQTR